MQKTITKIEPFSAESFRKKRVAAYARVSAEKDAAFHSLSAQVSYYSELIQKNSQWEFAGVFADNAVTGTKQDRPEFQKMLEDCRNGKIDMIITKAISRFSRNTVTTLTCIRELKELGIAVFFEEENINSLSGDGELMLTVLSAFAQEQSYNVSEDCKWRIKKQFEQGIQPMCLQRLYGYKRTDDGGFEIIEDEAKVIRFIFSSYLSGMGLKRICDDLNHKGIPSPKGGQWNMNGLKYLIINEKYCGDLLLQKSYRTDHITKKKVINRGGRNQYYVEDNHQPIILRETFLAVQAEMKKRAKENKGAQTHDKYSFTGMIVCKNCGKYYKRKVSKCNNKYRRVFWNCSTFLTKGKAECHTKQIPDDTLMEISAEVLGIKSFDEKVLKQKIQRIEVSKWNNVVFVFKDGTEVEKPWQDKSRKWTEEMKQCQREMSLLSLQGNNL